MYLGEKELCCSNVRRSCTHSSFQNVQFALATSSSRSRGTWFKFWDPSIYDRQNPYLHFRRRVQTHAAGTRRQPAGWWKFWSNDASWHILISHVKLRNEGIKHNTRTPGETHTQFPGENSSHTTRHRTSKLRSLYPSLEHRIQIRSQPNTLLGYRKVNVNKPESQRRSRVNWKLLLIWNWLLTELSVSA